MGGTTLSAGYANALGIEPEFDAQPRTVDEIAEAVHWADGAGKAVIPWGAGNGQTYGYVPRRADILLDLTRLNRFIAIEPGDLTITVEAGATLASVQAALAPYKQYLPVDVPDADHATLGGILATNAALNHTALRDYLIGITVIDAQGRLIKGGGKVVKNVTGYDIPKMHIGALGTLGIIVEATFKVAPRPEATQTLQFTGIDEALLRRLHTETIPAKSRWRTDAESDVLTVTYSGIAEVVADDAEKAKAVVGGRWSVVGAQIADSRQQTAAQLPTQPTTELWRPSASPATVVSQTKVVQHPLQPTTFLARIAGLPDGAAARHAALKRVAKWESIETGFASGATNVSLSADADAERALEKLTAWAETEKASFAVLHAPTDLRRGEYRLWYPAPPALPLMRRLKETLDPNGTLNPGRFIDQI